MTTRSSLRRLLRVLAVVSAGALVTLVAGVVLYQTTESLVVCGILGPTLGGVVAGWLSKGGRLAGSAVGIGNGLLVAVGGIVAYVLVLQSVEPTTGGAGLGFAFLLLMVVAGGVLAVLFGGIGGLIGAVIAENGTESAANGSGASSADRDAAPTPNRKGSIVEADTTGASRRPTATNVLAGAGVAVAGFVVPLSPLLGGITTGYLERGGRSHGAVVGAATGVVATVVAIAVIFVLATPTYFITLSILQDLLPYAVGLCLVYAVPFAAVGGVVGDRLAGDG